MSVGRWQVVVLLLSVAAMALDAVIGPCVLFPITFTAPCISRPGTWAGPRGP